MMVDWKTVAIYLLSVEELKIRSTMINNGMTDDTIAEKMICDIIRDLEEMSLPEIREKLKPFAEKTNRAAECLLGDKGVSSFELI